MKYLSSLIILIIFSLQAKAFEINKPTLILIGNNKIEKNILKDKYLLKALKHFNIIAVNEKKRPDLLERYKGKNSLPCASIINEQGQIISRESNFTALTLTNSLLRYLEGKKDPYLKKSIRKEALKNTFEVFGFTYFFNNKLELNDRTTEIINFFKERKKDFMGIKLFPLLSLYLSTLKLNNYEFLKLEVIKDIDQILNSKIFDGKHIYKYSTKDWNHPSKEFSINENIKLLEILSILKDISKKYEPYFNNLSLFLKKELENNIEDREKLNIYASIIKNNKNILNDDYLTKINKVIDKMENKFILVNNISILNVYNELNNVKKINNNKFKNFLNKLIKDYYLNDIFLFRDVKKDKQAFSYKYASFVQNLSLASILINTSYSKYVYPILSALNHSSLGYIVNSQYLYIVSKYKK